MNFFIRKLSLEWRQLSRPVHGKHRTPSQHRPSSWTSRWHSWRYRDFPRWDEKCGSRSSSLGGWDRGCSEATFPCAKRGFWPQGNPGLWWHVWAGAPSCWKKPHPPHLGNQNLPQMVDVVDGCQPVAAVKPNWRRSYSRRGYNTKKHGRGGLLARRGVPDGGLNGQVPVGGHGGDVAVVVAVVSLTEVECFFVRKENYSFSRGGLQVIQESTSCLQLKTMHSSIY